MKEERSFGLIRCWKCSIVVAFYVTLHYYICATYYINVKRWFKQLISFLFIFEDIMALYYISKLIQHREFSLGKDRLPRHVAVITRAVPLKKKYCPWQYWKTLFSDIFKLLFQVTVIISNATSLIITTTHLTHSYTCTSSCWQPTEKGTLILCRMCGGAKVDMIKSQVSVGGKRERNTTHAESEKRCTC